MQNKTPLPPYIFFGDILRQFSSWLETQHYSSYFILVDTSSSIYCLPEIQNIRPDINWHIIEIPRGEQYKTITTCSLIWDALFKNGADRHSLLVNLGGGVIGDMGGFAASTYMRGIDFVQIPTTLLAMVDASVGGKLAVDFKLAKNIIGLFKNPVANFIDCRWLKTLPNGEKRSGWAEILKHAIIADEAAFRKMKSIPSFHDIRWEDWVQHSVQIKYQIVQNDPKEKGLRKGLNFGHTVGHAIETYFLEHNEPKTHGECVAIGMVCAAYISNQTLSLPDSQLVDIVNVIKKWYDPIIIPKQGIPQILSLMRKDKKNRAGKPNFTLIPSIGSYVYDQYPNLDLIADSLHFYNDQI
ncbi:MAG TPA: 3-dehydroquinate synthase [Saprospiraceae bacterium]|nr:3-dehydroquinate synthase [Saprospiraceae bacterium]